MSFRDLAEHLPGHTLKEFFRRWPADPAAHPRLVHLLFCERCRRRCERLAPKKARVFLRSISGVRAPAGRFDEESLRQLAALIRRHEVECERGTDVAWRLLNLEPGHQRRAFVRSLDPPLPAVVVANAIRVLLPDLIHDRPADIRDLAALSLELLEDTRGRWPRTWLDIAADLEAHAGNACRLLSDPRAARRRFAHAIALAAESPDDLVQARVGHLTSVYLRDARRFETADQLAEFARAIYEEVESHEEAGRVEFLQATIPYYRGDLETAVRKLLALREKVLDTITRLSVTNLLSRSYVLLGPSFKAVKLLPEVQELARCFTSPSIQVYIDWLKGLILGHAGQTEPAGRLLSKVEHLFLEQGKLTESALVVLDRADLYARIGRHREAAEAARSVIGAFEVTEKHQEALAALRLYVEADRSAKEQIGKELRLYLPLAQADPGFKYRPGCIIG